MSTDSYIVLDGLSDCLEHRLMISGVETTGNVDEVDMRNEISVWAEIPTIVSLPVSSGIIDMS